MRAPLVTSNVRMNRDLPAPRPISTRPTGRGVVLAACLTAIGSASTDCAMGDSAAIDFVTDRADKKGSPKKPFTPCASSAECPPSIPYCDPTTAMCIECLADPNCAGPKAFCGPRGWCVECLGDAECAKGKPHCDTEQSTCAECLVDAHCEATKVCDAAERRCVPRCADDSTCEPMKPHCDAARRLCVECLTDANCGDLKKPACGAFGRCVECTTPAQCVPDRPLCNVEEGKCVCLTDSDCPTGKRCDPMRHCAP
jgi:Cys-rich repeat protein